MSLLEQNMGNGWAWNRVGQFYEVTRKPRDLNRSAFETIPFAAMEAIPEGGAYDADFTMKAPEAIVSGTYFERGDVLLAKITPSFENGKQALAMHLPSGFGYASTEIIPLRSRRGGHDPRFLFFYLLHPDVRQHLAERMEGSTGRQRVPEDVLLNLPFPDIAESDQKAIANALEIINLGRATEGECEENARCLKHSAMHVLFTRGLRGGTQRESEIGPVPESWDVVPLGSLGRVGNGSTPKKSTSEYWSGGTFPWLTSAKVYDREITSADRFVTETALRQCHLPRVEPGAVLIAITGQGKTLGHCAVLRMTATINQHLAYVATDTARANPSFVRGYLETQYGYLRQVGAGGGSTKGALTCAFLREMPIPLPTTLEEQQEIVAVLDALDGKIDVHRKKRVVLEELFKAVMHNVLTGEISLSDLKLDPLAMAQAIEVTA